MSQNNQEKMYQLGVAMDDYRKFFWTGVCLFFLIIPLFILLWKYIKFIIALNDVRQTSPENENLKYGFFSLVIGIALSLVNGAAGSAYYDASFYITGFQIVCFIFGWIKLEQWGGDLYRERGTGNMAQLKDGFKDIKIAQILSFIIIGFFMMPGAFGKAGGALMREFGQGRHTARQPVYRPPQQPQYGQPQQPQYGQPQQPQYGQPQQPQYGQPQQPQYGQPQQPPTQSPESPTICPQCGDTLSGKNLKFCGTCGYKF